jgi:hypothetical protein
MFQFDDDTFGHGAAAGIFDQSSGALGKIFEPFAEEVSPALTENQFSRRIGERQAQPAIEANVGFLYGVEDRQGLVHLAAFESADFRRSLRLDSRHGGTVGWRQKGSAGLSRGCFGLSPIEPLHGLFHIQIAV